MTLPHFMIISSSRARVAFARYIFTISCICVIFSDGILSFCVSSYIYKCMYVLNARAHKKCLNIVRATTTTASIQKHSSSSCACARKKNCQQIDFRNGQIHDPHNARSIMPGYVLVRNPFKKKIYDQMHICFYTHE